MTSHRVIVGVGATGVKTLAGILQYLFDIEKYRIFVLLKSACIESLLYANLVSLKLKAYFLCTPVAVLRSKSDQLI